MFHYSFRTADGSVVTSPYQANVDSWVEVLVLIRQKSREFFGSDFVRLSRTPGGLYEVWGQYGRLGYCEVAKA